MKKLTLVTTMLLLSACQTGLPTNTQPAAQARVPGELVVRFKPGTTDTDKALVRQSVGATGVLSVMPDGERWTLPAGADLDAAIARLGSDPHLKFAQPNRVRGLDVLYGADPVNTPTFSLQDTTAPNDPDYSKQWNLKAAHFDTAWSHDVGQGITVAVIDSGVDPNHPDLKDNLLPLVDEVTAMGNHDVLNGTSYDGKDGHGHGTHVCGIVGAVQNNAIGVTGGAPGVKILPVKVTTASGDADDATITKGITDAVDKGARVINLSIGGPEPSNILLEALNYAFNHNVAVVIAAGNDGRGVNYPAAYAGVLSVGATTPQNQVASYSSHGNQLVVVAPGGGTPGSSEGNAIYSTTPTYDCYITLFEHKPQKYGYLAGTSMSAPQVTATVALLLSQEPSLTPAQVRTRIAATADDLGTPGPDEYYGYGELDVARALAGNQD